MVVVDILSSSKLNLFFECLKTDNWKKLSEKDKCAFFIKFNEKLSKIINIDEVELVVGDCELSSSSFLSDIEYRNLYINSQGELVINDINYNQYLTMYEYLYKMRLYMFEMTYLGEFEGKFDDETLELVYKNYRNVSYGEFSLKLDKDESDAYEEFQFINKNARKFAETIMFKVVRNNYDFNNGHDEEYFMSNCNVLYSDYIEEIGERNLGDHIVDVCFAIDKLEKMKKKIEALEEKDLSIVEDKELLFMVYPSIIKNSDPAIVIRSFNEIIKRIYGDDFKIVWDNKNLIINNNLYSVKELPNLLNIVLYECLNHIDYSLRINHDFLNEQEIKDKGIDKAIFSYKKKWLYSVIRKIDASNNPKDFGVFGYQSIYRLLNKQKVESVLKKTNGKYFPLRKGGVK